MSQQQDNDRRTVFERIEDRTLQPNLGLRPSRTSFDVSQNEWDEIRQVSESAGKYISIGGGTSFSFLLYNSPTQGLTIIYISNFSDTVGWYPITMAEVQQTCCLNQR